MKIEEMYLNLIEDVLRRMMSYDTNSVKYQELLITQNALLQSYELYKELISK